MPDPDKLNEEIALLERATEGIEIIVCNVCGLDGKVGGDEPKWRVPCPRCKGTHVTTRMTDEHAS